MLVEAMLFWVHVLGAPAVRDSHQVALFRQAHPCPATSQRTGPCPGYIVDHKYPLCAGGKDEPSNMQWETVESSLVKDRLERELCACKRGKP